LEGDSYHIGYTFGGAYEINDMISVAGGLRYIDAHQEFDGDLFVSNPAPTTNLRVDLEREADGWGYFLGVNLTPINDLNIGLIYQSNTELDFKSDVENDDIGVTPLLGWADGTKQREDLPGLIGLGVGYQIIPKLRAEVAYTRYLEDAAKFESSRFDSIGDSWEAAISLTYAFTPKWRASIGYMHTDIKGMDPYELLAEAPELDVGTIGLGAVYSPTAKLQFTFSYTYVSYDYVTTDFRSVTARRAPEGTEYEKEVQAFSVGVQYRWF
jgi:long-chain fatty acid transport protein